MHLTCIVLGWRPLQKTFCLAEGWRDSVIGLPVQFNLIESATRSASLVARLGRLADGMPPAGLILLSMLSIQVSSALATELFVDLGPIGTTVSSSIFAAIILTLIVRPKLDRRQIRHAGWIVGFGVVDACMALPFFLALQYIPLGIASAVAFCGPLGLAIITSRRVIDFLWIALAVAGIALMTPLTGEALDPLGLGLAAISAIAWALFVLVARRLGGVLPGNVGLTLGMWAASVIMLPFALGEGTMLRIGDLGLGGLAVLAGAGAVGLLNVILPLTLEFRALQRMPARSYGILVTLEPAIGALVGLIWLGQAISLRASLAIGCVTLAALGVSLTDGNRD